MISLVNFTVGASLSSLGGSLPLLPWWEPPPLPPFFTSLPACSLIASCPAHACNQLFDAWGGNQLAGCAEPFSGRDGGYNSAVLRTHIADMTEGQAWDALSTSLCLGGHRYQWTQLAGWWSSYDCKWWWTLFGWERNGWIWKGGETQMALLCSGVTPVARHPSGSHCQTSILLTLAHPDFPNMIAFTS